MVKRLKTRVSIAGFAVGALALSLVLSSPAYAGETNPNGDPAGKDEAAALEALKQTVDDERYETLVMLEKAGVVGPRSELASIIADAPVNEERTLELHYYEGSPLAAQLREAVNSVKGTPLPVELVPVDFDINVVNETAREISLSGSDSLRASGIDTINSVDVDTLTGKITVRTDDEVTDAAVRANPGLNFESGGSVEFQSRQTDSAPYSGGASLSYGAGTFITDCTAGFNWVEWGGNTVKGSTAAHCNPGTPYYNGYSTFGWFFSENFWNVDTTLLSGPGFNPNVFVGGVNTNDVRWVVGANPIDSTGQTVVLSGGHSGLSLPGTTQGTAFISGVGPYRKTTVKSCLGGDSGGPWLTTNGSGNAIAHGQHGGRQYNSSTGATTSCLYMPVTWISSTMEAHIYTH
jgi:hypothetical protein